MILLGLPSRVLSPQLRVPCPDGNAWDGVGAVLALAGALFFSGILKAMLLRQDKNMVVRRDYAASVISVGKEWTRCSWSMAWA